MGQGKYLYLTLCTGNALAVELEDTAMAGTVIVVIVIYPGSQYHRFPKEAFGVTHMFVRYLMIIVPSIVKSFVMLRFLTPAVNRYPHAHVNLCVEPFSLSQTSRERFVLSLQS